MRALTRDEVRDVDRRAIEHYGLPGVVLMENAGRNAAQVLHGLVRASGPSGPISVACGRGNNGGDGFVIARHLENLGHDVRLLLACDPADYRGDAAINCRVAERSGSPIEVLADADRHRWERRLDGTAWIVDALLGTGVTGAARGAVATAIEAINHVRDRGAARVLAVDLPSGLDCDTGLPLGACVRADVTVTFVAAKSGFERPGAGQFTGAVHVADIGVPRALLRDLGLT
jgi:NAD(P)H-hydrate epimerase